MISARAEKIIAMLFDIALLSPASFYVVESFNDKTQTPAHEIFFSHPSVAPAVASVLTLLFAISAYFLFFHYILRQTPGHFFVRQKNFPIQLKQIQIPKSLALASSTLILIFSSLLYLSFHSHVSGWQSSHLDRCSIIDQSMMSSSSDRKTPPSRIEVSLALFEAELLSPSCLRAEALRVLDQPEFLSQAYLGLSWASGVLTETESRKAQVQFSQICLNGAKYEACQIVRAAHSSRAVASIGPDLNQSEYLILYELKQLQRAQQFDEALRVLNGFSFSPVLAPFVAQKRLEVLWQLGQREAARSSYRNAIDFLSPKDRLKFAHSMCRLELGLSCEDKVARACQDYVSAFKSEGQPEEFRPNYERALRCLSVRI